MKTTIITLAIIATCSTIVHGRFSILISTQLATLNIREHVPLQPIAAKSTKNIDIVVQAIEMSSLILPILIFRMKLTSESMQSIAKIVFISYLILYQLLLVYLKRLVENENDETLIAAKPGPSSLFGLDSQSTAAKQTITVKSYDLSEIEKMRNNWFMEVCVASYFYTMRKTVNSLVSLVVTGLLRLVSSPLIRVLVFREEAIGKLSRPFKSAMEMWLETVKQNIEERPRTATPDTNATSTTSRKSDSDTADTNLVLDDVSPPVPTVASTQLEEEDSAAPEPNLIADEVEAGSSAVAGEVVVEAVAGARQEQVVVEVDSYKEPTVTCSVTAVARDVAAVEDLETVTATVS